jgi:tetratricopeptide (TPR) repeat protein
MAALALGLALAVPAPAQIRLDDSDQPSAARARYDAIRALREGRYDEVLALLAAVPSDPDVLLVRGRVLALTGRYDLAQSAFEAAAARRPASDAALDLGRLHLTLGRATEARHTLEPIIAAGLHSDLGEVIGRAARAAQLLGRYEQANNLFRDAAALIGDDADLQIAWGQLFLEKQNKPEAVRSFRAALTGDRSHQVAFRAALKERAAITTERLNAIPGVSCVAPTAAFYAMPRVTLPPGKTDEDYVYALLRATGVLCVYGSGFGTQAEDGYFRIVFLASPAELQGIYGLMADFTKEYLR